MDEVKDVLKDININWDTSPIVDLICKVKHKLGLMESKHKEDISHLQDEVDLLEGKVHNLSKEIEVLSVKFESIRERYQRKHSERFSLFKEITEFESMIDNLSENISANEAKRGTIEKEINSISYPSLDFLFLELMKLSGVDFTSSEEDDGIHRKIRIKNYEDKDILFLPIYDNLEEENENNQESIKMLSNKIWENMGFK